MVIQRARTRRPDTTRLRGNDIDVLTRHASEFANVHSGQHNQSIIPTLQRRNLHLDGLNWVQRHRMIQRLALVPNKVRYIENYDSKVFCGLYSNDGNFFVSATQDKMLSIYLTPTDTFEQLKRIRALDVGWSILDVAFSPDNRYVAYASWADHIYQCSLARDENILETFPLQPTNRQFCVFSIAFSTDNRLILGGANDGNIYAYDRETQQQVIRYPAHLNTDVNSITFSEDNWNTIYSAGDDGLCKVWDIRTLNQNNPRATGMFAGHRDGLTYVSSRGDSRYLITNSKDQSIKLWDTRAFSNRAEPMNPDWDYRWQHVPIRLCQSQMMEGDTSVMTYYGHSVLKTLIRCRFSPAFTTGQRFIYTGDSRGRFIIYELLTGKIICNMRRHVGCVRDVIWHPFRQHIITSSWDGKIAKWEYMPDDIGDVRPIVKDERTSQLLPLQRAEQLVQKRPRLAN